MEGGEGEDPDEMGPRDWFLHAWFCHFRYNHRSEEPGREILAYGWFRTCCATQVESNHLDLTTSVFPPYHHPSLGIRNG